MDVAENRRRDRLLAESLVDAYQKGWDAGFTGEVFAKDIRPLLRRGREISYPRVLIAAGRLDVHDDEEFGPWLVFVERALRSLLDRLPSAKGNRWHST